MNEEQVFILLMWLCGMQVAFNGWVAVSLIKLNVTMATLLALMPKRLTDQMKQGGG